MQTVAPVVFAVCGIVDPLLRGVPLVVKGRQSEPVLEGSNHQARLGGKVSLEDGLGHEWLARFRRKSPPILLLHLPSIGKVPGPQPPRSLLVLLPPSPQRKNIVARRRRDLKNREKGEKNGVSKVSKVSLCFWRKRPACAPNECSERFPQGFHQKRISDVTI